MKLKILRLIFDFCVLYPPTYSSGVFQGLLLCLYMFAKSKYHEERKDESQWLVLRSVVGWQQALGRDGKEGSRGTKK